MVDSFASSSVVNLFLLNLNLNRSPDERNSCKKRNKDHSRKQVSGPEALRCKGNLEIALSRLGLDGHSVKVPLAL